MGIGTSILLIATGAILDYAVDVRTTGITLHTVGAILMIAGVIGLLLSLLFWSTWGGWGVRRRDVVVRDDAPPIARRHVYEEEVR